MPFRHRTRALFHHSDAAGIVFFANVFVLAHDGYEAFIRHIGVDWASFFASRTISAPIRHAEAEYFRPIFAGSELSVEIVIARIGETSFTLEYSLIGEEGLHAKVRMVHAFLDFQAKQKTPIPADFRARLEARREAEGEAEGGRAVRSIT